MEFVIIGNQFLAPISALAHNPLPEQPRDGELFTGVPRQGMSPSLFDVGERHITTIANNVDDQGIRNLALNFPNVKEVVGSAVCPALDALLLCGFLHYHAKEIARAMAFMDDLLAKQLGVEAGCVEQLALKPTTKQRFPMAFAFQVSESLLENAEDV